MRPPHHMEEVIVNILGISLMNDCPFLFFCDTLVHEVHKLQSASIAGALVCVRGWCVRASR